MIPRSLQDVADGIPALEILLHTAFPCGGVLAADEPFVKLRAQGLLSHYPRFPNSDVLHRQKLRRRVVRYDFTRKVIRVDNLFGEVLAKLSAGSLPKITQIGIERRAYGARINQSLVCMLVASDPDLAVVHDALPYQLMIRLMKVAKMVEAT